MPETEISHVAEEALGAITGLPSKLSPGLNNEKSKERAVTRTQICCQVANSVHRSFWGYHVFISKDNSQSLVILGTVIV